MSKIVQLNTRRSGKIFAQTSLHAADWIMRFGFSTKNILEDHLFPSGQVKDLSRDLFARGWATEISCRVEGPSSIIVLTKEGYNAVRDEYEPSLEYPEMEWTYCDLERCSDLLMIQQATADNLRAGSIDQFWTSRMIRFQDGYPSPGAEWLMRSGELMSVDADTGCSFPWRHELCVNLSIRMGEEKPRYNRAALFSTSYDIIKDYHSRLGAGKKLPIWEGDPVDFEPIAEVNVPDLSRRLMVFMTDKDQEIII